jgi:hypothetical protein
VSYFVTVVSEFSCSILFVELYDVVDDYIRFAPNVVAGNPRILTSVLQMASSVLHAQLPEEELIYGFKILQSVLLNCRGLLNVHCGEILAIILSSVSGSISLRFRLHCFESVFATLTNYIFNEFTDSNALL